MSDYVPLRRKVSEAHDLAKGYQAQIDDLKERFDELQKVVIQILTAERRLVRGEGGKPEAVELYSNEGDLIHRREFKRDGGRIAGAK